MISENLRGVALKILVENEFDIEKTISLISGTEDYDTNIRVRSKIQTFLSNIESDLKEKQEKKTSKPSRNSFHPSIKTFRQNFIHILMK